MGCVILVDSLLELIIGNSDKSWVLIHRISLMKAAAQPLVTTFVSSFLYLISPSLDYPFLLRFASLSILTFTPGAPNEAVVMCESVSNRSEARARGQFAACVILLGDSSGELTIGYTLSTLLLLHCAFLTKAPSWDAARRHAHTHESVF